jgi:glycosyltransferase involved in cell wall biosynthesis
MARAGLVAFDFLKASAMSKLPGVSIIIGNYNYAQFVGAAIDSALAQDHSRCEVIVVDDGSTDGSQAVIERYRDRTRVILLPTNRGQVAALNEAWPLAECEIIMFLDSDDLLEPHAASTIARNWKADVVKVQFPMKSIDVNGTWLNHIAPKYPPDVRADTLRDMLLKFGDCYLSPGSGNAYAKRLLEKLSPISGLPWMDIILGINAPFCGEVITLAAPLASYRIHDAQWSGFSSVGVSRFTRYLEVQEGNYVYLSEFFRRMGLAFDPGHCRMASQWYCQCLIAVSRLSTPGERWYVPAVVVIGRAFRAFLLTQHISLKRRAALLVWTAAVAVAPQKLVERLLELRFSMSKRPGWLERIVSRVAS